MERDPIFVVAMIACLMVVAILLFGLTAFVRGGAFNKKYANRLMQYRIIVQAGAVLLILIAVAVK